VAVEPVVGVEELIERVRVAPPPGDDDVSILLDGRRLDSREAVMAWLAEVDAQRRQEHSAGEAGD